MSVFLSSFLVLFLEVALIRWMPAYIRLLAFFSNFILLASFLGIGVGCLLAARPPTSSGRPEPAEGRPSTLREAQGRPEPGRGTTSSGRLFAFFPAIQAGVVATVYFFRLEVAVPTSGSIYFSSGTAQKVVLVESTLLLPLLFVIVAALFVALAERMGREMARLPPLRGYTLNLAGSLAGVAAFAVCSWLELSPTVWFAVAFAAAVPLLLTATTGITGNPELLPRVLRAPRGGGRHSAFGIDAVVVVINVVLLAASLGMVHVMARDALWSPYYKITVRQEGADTVVEVNNIFHQSMAPVAHKEYFYEWPYTVFGDTFGDVLILGAGSGTDVAAALHHGVRHVDAVEIDPAILRLGRERHPDRPYADPRVTLVTDDARHFLRTTEKTYDLIVFALIDSLTLQSSFPGVRLESYMFTEESFRAVRDRLKDDGLLVIYNYFRERWLVDRLANTAAAAFGEEPRVHVHEARAYLGVLMAGPRLARLTTEPRAPDRVAAFGQSPAPSPARRHRRDASIQPATDDWPFLYLREPHLPRHYAVALAVVLILSAAAVILALQAVAHPVEQPYRAAGSVAQPFRLRVKLRRTAGASAEAVRAAKTAGWSWQFFLLGAGFMLLETKSIIQFALLWGSTWVVASLAIASVLTMALAANAIVARREIARPWLVGAVLVALLAANFAVPIGRIGFESRAVESTFYALLVFSPILCAGLLFGSAIKRSTSVARDYGTNLLGAMVGGVGEYLSLVTGFRVLLAVIAVCYVGALVARRVERLGSGLES
jgi:SAM-dependent methyltransferase